MPMIDVYAATGTFADDHQLAVDLASAVMKVEQVPDIPLFRTNTAAFIHLLPAQCLANVDGDSTHVRIQVLTNAGALNRDKQLAVVAQLTAIVAAAAGDPSLADRTWVLLTEAPDGGWGLAGHASSAHRDSAYSGLPNKLVRAAKASTTHTGTPAQGLAAVCRWSCSSTFAETSTAGIPR